MSTYLHIGLCSVLGRIHFIVNSASTRLLRDGRIDRMQISGRESKRGSLLSSLCEFSVFFGVRQSFPVFLILWDYDGGHVRTCFLRACVLSGFLLDGARRRFQFAECWLLILLNQCNSRFWFHRLFAALFIIVRVGSQSIGKGHHSEDLPSLSVAFSCFILMRSS
jgi:hypothetical protein